MTKEHKKLYKAGKNWIVATLTATIITLLGGIGAYTVHADTTAENNQSTETSNISQASQSDNSGNLIVLSQPAPAQSNQTTENNQSVQESQINQGGNQSTSTTPTTETAFAATNSSDGLDPSIYGTVNVRDWDYQKDNNLINLTGYHGTDLQHIIIPNLNDFNNASIDISGTEDVGITSTVLDQILGQLKGPDYTVAISKTSGNYNNKVIATDQDWSGVFGGTGLINVDVSNLDTRNITDMSGLFAQSYKLKTVGDLSQWNTSNVTNMSYLFSFPPFGNYLGNYQLNNVGDLGKWDTRNVTDMSGMFAGSSIVPGNIGNWNVSNVKDMSGMFDNSHEGDIGDLSHWDTSNVTDMSYMFSSSSTSVSGLTHWNTKNVRDMSDMFDASDLPYEIVASNASAVIPNQVTLKDSTGKILALIDTPTIYNSHKSVKATINEIVQAEIDKLNKLNHTLYETPKIISDGDDDYSIANATYVVNNESKTGLINYVDQDGKVVKTDQVSGKVGDKVDVKLSLPDGYELANKDEQVPSTITVGDDGIKTININIKKIPVIKTGTINYIDPDGKVVKTDQVSGKVGDKVDVKLSLPDGYELANKDEQVPSTITVGDDGISPISVNIKKINTTPTTPVNPTEPNNPTNPAQPSNPTTPENPTEPINPSTPSDNNVTGWRNSSDGNHYVYYKDNQPLAGRRYVSLPTINGVGTSWYLVDNGVVQSGVQKWAGTYYYFDPVTYLKVTNDYRQSQWGDWYLFGNDGRILTGVQKWAGSYYYFDPVTYLKVTNDYRQSQWGSWYLFGNDGRILTGVQKWAGSYYYFDPVTYLKVTNSYRQSQWGDWYMFGPDGRIVSGLYNWLGNLYYFDPVTYLKVTNQYVYVGGVRYWADANGCLSRA